MNNKYQKNINKETNYEDFAFIIYYRSFPFKSKN